MKKLNRLLNLLKKRKLTLATAESASGGYVSYLLTKIPQSSKIFKGGLIVYSLDSKHSFFKLPLAYLKKTQGVSKEIAATLAIKVRKKLQADIGLSIVGFAGPNAPKEKKGLLFIAISDEDSTLSFKVQIKGTRDLLRRKVSILLLELLYLKLK